MHFQKLRHLRANSVWQLKCPALVTFSGLWQGKWHQLPGIITAADSIFPQVIVWWVLQCLWCQSLLQVRPLLLSVVHAHILIYCYSSLLPISHSDQSTQQDQQDSVNSSTNKVFRIIFYWYLNLTLETQEENDSILNHQLLQPKALQNIILKWLVHLCKLGGKFLIMWAEGKLIGLFKFTWYFCCD